MFFFPVQIMGDALYTVDLALWLVFHGSLFLAQLLQLAFNTRRNSTLIYVAMRSAGTVCEALQLVKAIDLHGSGRFTPELITLLDAITVSIYMCPFVYWHWCIHRALFAQMRRDVPRGLTIADTVVLIVADLLMLLCAVLSVALQQRRFECGRFIVYSLLAVYYLSAGSYFTCWLYKLVSTFADQAETNPQSRTLLRRSMRKLSVYHVLMYPVILTAVAYGIYPICWDSLGDQGMLPMRRPDPDNFDLWQFFWQLEAGPAFVALWYSFEPLRHCCRSSSAVAPATVTDAGDVGSMSPGAKRSTLLVQSPVRSPGTISVRVLASGTAADGGGGAGGSPLLPLASRLASTDEGSRLTS